MKSFKYENRLQGQELLEVVNEIKAKLGYAYSSFGDRCTRKIAKACGYINTGGVSPELFEEYTKELRNAQCKHAKFTWEQRLTGLELLDQIEPIEIERLYKTRKRSSGEDSKKRTLLKDIAIRCGYFKSVENTNEYFIEVDEFINQLNPSIKDTFDELDEEKKLKKQRKKSISKNNPIDSKALINEQVDQVIDESEPVEIGEASMDRIILSAVVNRRKRSPRFKKSVLSFHGNRCACCQIDLRELIQAAHIRPVAANGSDEVGNGIPLCPTHHAAFDASLFAIDPKTQSIIFKDGVTAEDLAITKKRLDLNLNIEALSFRMKTFKDVNGINNF